MKDPQLLEDAKRQNLDISPWTGARLQQVVAEVLDTPAADVIRIKQAIDAGNAEEIRGEKVADSPSALHWRVGDLGLRSVGHARRR